MYDSQKKALTVIILFGSWLFFGCPQTVAAHVYLERSDPAPESWLEQSPESIQLRFNQTIQADISYLWIEDERGQRIEGPLFGQDGKLTLQLPTLKEGIYAVHWRIIGFDAYVTEGSYRFFVGDNVSMNAFGSTYSNDDWMRSQQMNAETAGTSDWGKKLRVIELLTVLSVSGWILFRMFLWSEEGHHLAGGNASTTLSRERYVLLCATVIFMLAGIGQVVHRALLLTQTSWQDPLLWQTAGVIFSNTLLGIVVGIRSIIMLLLVLLAYSKQSRKWMKLVLILGLITTYSILSHAYHSQMILPQTIHLLAVAFWSGGLLGFTIYSFFMKYNWESLTYLHQRLKHFSTLSFYTFFIASMSGATLMMVYVGSWDNLTTSDYGQTLLWKMVIIAPILLIAIWHRWVWWPVLQQAYTQQEGMKAIRALFWGIRLEVILAIVVIVMAGMLSQTNPPGNIHQGHDHDKLNVHLEIKHSVDSRDTLFRAYVLKDRQRLQNAEVTFNIWDKEYEDLFINVQDYCTDNNMSMSVFEEALIERGFIRQMSGKEEDDHVYIVELNLEPGRWNVAIRIEHEDEDVFEYRDFTVEIEELEVY